MNFKKKHGRNYYRSNSFIVLSNKDPLWIPDSGQPSPLAFQYQTPPTVRRWQLSWVILGHQTEKTFRCKKVWVPRLAEWKTEIAISSP